MSLCGVALGTDPFVAPALGCSVSKAANPLRERSVAFKRV